MFATKKDAETWIDRYTTRVLFVPRKIGREWRVVKLDEPLTEEQIRVIEKRRESRERIKDAPSVVCIDCGADNAARAEIGRSRCIDCQEAHERSNVWLGVGF